MKLKTGDTVQTEFGEGVVVGIDLPDSDVWRWIVKITEPKKDHVLIKAGKTMCFFDKEIK